MQKEVRLYDIPSGSKIYAKAISDGSKFIIFDHLDGIYSYCTTEKGGVIHLSGAAPLREINVNEYELILPES